MWDNLFFALLFFLPAGTANAVPVFAAKLPLLKDWNTPIDMGRSWRGARLFGDHKTWRGLVCGTAAAIMVALATYPLTRTLAGLGESTWQHVVLMGGLLGLGALVGDMLKSFFKRRANVRPGSSWFPLDQLDYIIGGLLLVTPVANLQLGQYAWIAITWFVLHLLSVAVGYLLGIRDQPI